MAKERQLSKWYNIMEPTKCVDAELYFPEKIVFLNEISHVEEIEVSGNNGWGEKIPALLIHFKSGREPLEIKISNKYWKYKEFYNAIKIGLYKKLNII